MDKKQREAILYARPGRCVFAAAAAAALLSSATAVAGQVQNASPPRGEVVREIDDPHSGDRWLLVRNAENPGGPGRMVLAGEAGQRATVIRAGDRVIVEERSPKVQARFEALALGSAPAGAHLNVRLAIGNKVVRVTALDRGRAVFADARESWR